MRRNAALCGNGLTLYHTILTFNEPPPPKTEKPFENIVGKGENAGNHHFLLSHNVFFPSLKKKKIQKLQNKFQKFSHVHFIVCTCFQFGPV